MNCASRTRYVDRIGLGPEAQVRHRLRPGLLRVIDEVRLHVDVGVLADDLDGVLVGADRPVGAEAVEHGPEHVVVLGRERLVHVQARAVDVVGDADGEAGARLRGVEFVEHRLDHGRRELLGRQPVASAYHARHRRARAAGHALGQGGDDVEVQRLARGPRLLGAVEHGNRPDARGQGLEQPRDGEGPVEAHLQHADLRAALHERLDGLARRTDA